MVTPFQDDFETGDLSKWTIQQNLNATITVSNTNPHHGSWSLKIVNVINTGDYAYTAKSVNSYASLYARVYFMLPADIAVSNSLSGLIWFESILGGSAESNVHLYRNADGTYKCGFYDSLPAMSYFGPDFTFVTGRWYCIEFYKLINDTVGIDTVWVDGVQQVTRTGNTGNSNIDQVRLECLTADNANMASCYYDDFTISDQYIGPETPSFARHIAPRGVPHTIS